MDRRRFFHAGTVGLAGAGAVLGSATPVHAANSAARWLTGGRAAGTPADPIRLSANENSLGLSPLAREAVIASLDVANRYGGNSTLSELQTLLAGRLGVRPDNLIMGNGSTEVLQVAVQASFAPGVPLIAASPTYEDVPAYAGPFAFDMAWVPLTNAYAHDIGRMREIERSTTRPTVVYICNPNNPTGTLTPSADIEAWIESASEQTLFIVDEAYFEYVDSPAYRSAIPLAVERPNVLVARTFSKIYGMAGLRIGYGIGHPDLLARLREFILAVDVNSAAQAGALASLKDEDAIPRGIESNKEARRITESCLDELGLEYLPSQTNFLMHRISGDLTTYQRRMADEGIVVGRAFPPMLDHNRLSFGTPSEMERWADTVRGFRGRGWI